MSEIVTVTWNIFLPILASLLKENLQNELPCIFIFVDIGLFYKVSLKV